MGEGVAATIRRMVERTEGLGPAARDDVLNIIRETHFRLFMRDKVLPWEDEHAIWTTRASLNRREDDLKELVEIKMLENSRAIGAAAELGDLSENSEWQFAIQERDLLKARAQKMQDEINRAKIIEPLEVTTGVVAIGSRVTLEPVAGGEAITATILGPWDSDVEQRIYSYRTPLALEMLGKKPGDTATLKLTGEPAEYRIVAAEPWRAE
jgi:transcription elongation factor GreA